MFFTFIRPQISPSCVTKVFGLAYLFFTPARFIGAIDLYYPVALTFVESFKVSGKKDLLVYCLANFSTGEGKV